MSLLFKTVARAWRLFHPQLRIGKGVEVDPRAWLGRGGKIAIGDNSIVRAGAFLLPSGGFISIGNNSSINQYVVINGEGGVTIGNSVMIASFCAFYAANHVFSDPTIPIERQGMCTRGGIKIADDVWIGTHAVILDGVSVGTGSVIAAGTVVTKDVPRFSIVAGVPGTVRGKRGQTIVPAGSVKQPC